MKRVCRSRGDWSRLYVGMDQDWSSVSVGAVKISHEFLWEPVGLFKSVCENRQEQEYLHEQAGLVKCV